MIAELELRRQFVEAYMARTTTQSMRALAREMAIEDTMLRQWLRDESFRNELADVDIGRNCMAREVAFRHITAAVENMARIAAGGNKSAVRAAYFLSQITGLTPQRGGATTTVNLNTLKADARDVAQILREYAEVEEVLREHMNQAAGMDEGARADG